jgi:hypothetical protein
MANQKYDNLMPLMATGKLNWATDPINAYLQSGATFDAAHTKLSETGGAPVAHVPVAQRSVTPAGFLGNPVSFNRIAKDTAYQVVIAKDTGPGTDPLVIAFYDEDEEGGPLVLQNNGTLIVRPVLVEGAEPPTLGIWVKI